MTTQQSKSTRLLDWIERTGNRLPDPAIYFLIALTLTVLISAILSNVQFSEIDPRTGLPLQIHNQLSGKALATFFSTLVTRYTSFPPLGLVLIMVLGVGVAEQSGLLGAGLQRLLHIAPRKLLTPVLATVGILSHIVADAAVVAVVPLGGALFYVAGRHPLAGITVAYATILGGFAANLIPVPIDPILSGFTQSAARLLQPNATVSPLSNIWFSIFLTLPFILVSWWLTDRVIEPRLAAAPVDGDPAALPVVNVLCSRERRALRLALGSLAILLTSFIVWAIPSTSALRDAHGSLTSEDSPLMRSIVPIMFLATLIPGMFYGYASGAFRSHRDVINSMVAALSRMSYYCVLVFFASLFILVFSESNLGALLALKGGVLIRSLGLPVLVTLMAIVVFTCTLDLVVGSASAKYAILAPIFVPMLLSAGISPEFTQLAYRIGDGPNNIITPLSPYFPLMVAFSVRYVRSAGVGTVLSLLLPFAISYILVSLAALAAYRALGLPVGL